MSLMDDFKAECVLLKKVKTPDGAGGFVARWEDGETFIAAIAADSSTEERPAERPGVSGRFTVISDQAVALNYHDAFRRISDGKVFRITSNNEKKSPKRATFDVVVMTAEEWSLPT